MIYNWRVDELPPHSLDPYRDRSGRAGVWIYSSGLVTFHPSHTPLGTIPAAVFCHDLRRLRDVGFSPSSDRPVVDVKLLAGGKGSLLDNVRDRLRSSPLYSELLEVEQTMAAHVTAAKIAHVDLTKVSVHSLVPARFLRRYAEVRGRCIVALGTMFPPDERYVKETYPLALVLYDVERNGIRVDVDFAREEVESGTEPEQKFFRSVLAQERNGYVYTLFNAVPGRTGRIKVESGFNSMGIPRGRCRKTIVSRYPRGRIVAFDFNAIDYRCIVQAVRDPGLTEFYRDSDDFHAQTSRYVFGVTDPSFEQRDLVKKITYMHAYGGSLQTLVGKSGAPRDVVEEVVRKLDVLFQPISLFRTELHERSLAEGHVTTFGNGRKIPLEGNDNHPGLVLGLYAQSFSSYVFERALRSVHKLVEGTENKILFTVHDELVVDCRDGSLVTQMVGTMEKFDMGMTFRVNVKVGPSYGELENVSSKGSK